MRRRDRAAHLLLLFAFAVIPAVVIAIGGFGFDQDIFCRSTGDATKCGGSPRINEICISNCAPHIRREIWGSLHLTVYPIYLLEYGLQAVRLRGVGDHIPVFTKALAFAFSG